MRTRAAIVSVFRATDDDGGFADEPKDILFRQPFHNLGLAMTFGFAKTYVSPFAKCDLVIENPSNLMVESFGFDRTTYERRPLVEIRAGYSDVEITTKAAIAQLKNSLDVVYTGYPYYVLDQKVVGGRSLTVSLSDVSTTFLQGKRGRVSEEFRLGQPILEVVKAILKEMNGVKFDLSELEKSPVAAKILPNSIMYNNIPIIPTVLPNLGREFGFYMSIDPTGILKFRPAGVIPATGTLATVGPKTGMIEHPARMNWTHWNVKTLFGLPMLFYPGTWMTVESDFLERGIVAESKTLTGVVINGDYQWQDESAMTSYVIAPEGEPVESQPVISTI